MDNLRFPASQIQSFMEHHQPNNTSPSSDPVGSVPNDSASFRSIPHSSESFRPVPNGSEAFRSVPNYTERTEKHTLTVREVARLFETAGVARTERSIVKWCQPNKTGGAKLDAYFDPNERKYYITPQSVDLAIGEEKAKAARNNEPSEPFRTVPQSSEAPAQVVPKRSEPADTDVDAATVKELEHQIWDLGITNKAKDMYIDQLQKERGGMLDQLLAANHRVGELETENKVLRLGPGGSEPKN